MSVLAHKFRVNGEVAQLLPILRAGPRFHITPKQLQYIRGWDALYY